MNNCQLMLNPEKDPQMSTDRYVTITLQTYVVQTLENTRLLTFANKIQTIDKTTVNCFIVFFPICLN